MSPGPGEPPATVGAPTVADTRPARQRWWHAAVGYEIYVRSFADSNDDGIGDLGGVLARLDHLERLGVDLLWLTPFYPSPMADHGYDVADYTDIDPACGSLADFDRLLEAVHDRGMRLLVDLVPNHTSWRHPWFEAARSSRDSAYRDYYVWRDPAADGGPPNNWTSHFGGPAWTYEASTGQYWLHLFLPEQPDLNWANPDVADEFDRILRFWLDRGADGFRIDVAHALVKDAGLRDNPELDSIDVAAVSSAPTAGFAHHDHVHDVDQPGVVEVYRRWRAIAEDYDALLLGEVYLLSADRLARYVRDQDGLHLAFWFKPLHLRWDPDALRSALEEAVAAAPGHLAWVQSSHDRSRPVTRFGGGDLGRQRALAMATLLMGLPGTPFLYQGEELGLDDGRLAPEQLQDPIAVREGDIAGARDGARTPMPWAPGHAHGFTAVAEPWLATGWRDDDETAAVQWNDPDAPVQRYQRLVRTRRALTDLHTEPVRWVSEHGPVIGYQRGTALVVANCGDEPDRLALPGGVWRVVFGTAAQREACDEVETLRLDPLEGVVLTTAPQAE